MRYCRCLHAAMGMTTLLFALGLGSPAVAQVSDAARAEARERFDRGLRLFNLGDNSGALAEFQRAYELVPHPMVLFNLGLVYAADRNPVASVEALDKLLANPGSVSADIRTRAQTVRNEQAALIGEILVTVNVDRAAIEVDNVEVAKSPPPGPLKVATGTHLVSVVAPGHMPSRRQVTVAGQTQVTVPFQLQPLEGQLAHVEVNANIVGADVLLDNEPVGKTPLPTSLAIAPGQHTVVIQRPGYIPVTQALNVGEGTTGAVNAQLQMDLPSLRTEGGRLTLDISEPDAVVFVDGAPVGAYGGAMELPHGEHVIKVERADFFPFERTVDIPKGSVANVVVELEPTPEKREAYRRHNKALRVAGWATLAVGAAVAGGGAGFLIWNKGQKDDKEALFNAALERYSTGNECDPLRNETLRQEAGCTRGTEEVTIRQESLDSTRKQDAIGYALVGVGGAALVTGIVLVAVADDPNRYEPKPESDVFAGVRVLPTGFLARGGGGFSLVGTF